MGDRNLNPRASSPATSGRGSAPSPNPPPHILDKGSARLSSCSSTAIRQALPSRSFSLSAKVTQLPGLARTQPHRVRSRGQGGVFGGAIFFLFCSLTHVRPASSQFRSPCGTSAHCKNKRSDLDQPLLGSREENTCKYRRAGDTVVRE